MTHGKDTALTKLDKSRRELTIEQLNAIALIVTGATDQAVADGVGVSRQTISAWRHSHPGFASALNAHREAVWAESADRLRGLIPLALGVLERALTADPEPDPRLALALLKLAGVDRLDLGGVGPSDPDRWEKIETARQREEAFNDMLAL